MFRIRWQQYIRNKLILEIANTRKVINEVRRGGWTWKDLISYCAVALHNIAKDGGERERQWGMAFLRKSPKNSPGI